MATKQTANRTARKQSTTATPPPVMAPEQALAIIDDFGGPLEFCTTEKIRRSLDLLARYALQHQKYVNERNRLEGLLRRENDSLERTNDRTRRGNAALRGRVKSARSAGGAR